MRVAVYYNNRDVRLEERPKPQIGPGEILVKVMASGILPFINTGVAHKEPGVGMVGAGLVRAPKKCFEDAFAALKTTFL